MEAAAMATSAAASNALAPPPRLVRAAHEFEAQMMKELIEPLQRGTAAGEDDGGASEPDGDSGSSGALGEFASEALAQALSERGGLGIATSILNKLSPPRNQQKTVPVTGNRTPIP
jgi:Rod binding domain-containing protein